MIDRLTPTLALDEPVERVRLVSPTRASALQKMGISTVRDLLYNFPRRYIDLSSKVTIAAAPMGATCTIECVVHEIKLKRPKPKLSLVEISVTDSTGVLIVTCFRQPWLMDKLKAGERIAIAGKVEFNYGYKRMTNPYLEALGDGAHAHGMIIPVHPACEAINRTLMRTLMRNALALVEGCLDHLPLALRTKYRLSGYFQALSSIHFPRSMQELQSAKRRLAYEEVLLLQLALITQEQKRSLGKPACVHIVDGLNLAAFMSLLPFELTEDQTGALHDIFREMHASKAANHMLLGDVGTGKTILAAAALAAVSDTGSQALMMAPTEVLAQQHAASIGPYFDKLGIHWGLLTGSTDAATRRELLKGLKDGSVTFCIGTHALLEDSVELHNLSLVIIDEQQRFGVGQRLALLAKGDNPDALYLTATPIPRTLALALYGSLTLSYLHTRPSGGAPRVTKLLAKAQQGDAYDAARLALERGEQVFVVCPLIGGDQSKQVSAAKGQKQQDEDSYVYASIAFEADADFDSCDVAAARKEAAFLQNKVFGDYVVGLLHGGLSSSEKAQVMERFSKGDIQVLVSTTVIEVGIDIPRATVMIIQDADRFGLSQLHQLRGRVGRHGLASEVYLISATKQAASLERLRALERSDDGFELANYDLSLRREGDILGNRQHGASSLKLVNVVRDAKIVEVAHRDACEISQLDPSLNSPEHKALGHEVRRLFDGVDLGLGG